MSRVFASLPWMALVFVLALAACQDAPPTTPPDEPPEPTPPEKPAFELSGTCTPPTLENLEGDRVVQYGFEKAAFDSLVQEDAGTPYEDAVVEEGGWIKQCRTQGASGSTSYYFDVITVKGTPRSRTSIDLDDATYLPGNETCRTVGTFHVHPTPHKGEPGTADIANAERRGVPAFIIENQADSPPPYRELPEWRARPYHGWNEAGKANLAWECGCEEALSRQRSSSGGLQLVPTQQCVPEQDLTGTWVGTMVDPFGPQNITMEILAHVGNDVSVSIIYESGNIWHAVPGVVQGDEVSITKTINGHPTHIWNGIVEGFTFSGTYTYNGPLHHEGPFSVTAVQD